MRSMKEHKANGSDKFRETYGPTCLERADASEAKLYRALKLEVGEMEYWMTEACSLRKLQQTICSLLGLDRSKTH
jgi:hypothetical protein